jgi:hypothetical protein
MFKAKPISGRELFIGNSGSEWRGTYCPGPHVLLIAADNECGKHPARIVLLNEVAPLACYAVCYFSISQLLLMASQTGCDKQWYIMFASASPFHVSFVSFAMAPGPDEVQGE